MSRTRRVDHGYKKLRANIETLASHEVAIGILGEAGSDLLNIASWNHDGTETKAGEEHIPSRPFLAVTFDRTLATMRKRMKAVTVAVLKGADPKAQLDRIGLGFAGEVKRTIATSVPPPNDPATIARKGSDTTLTDTGRLRNSVASEVRKKS